MKTLFVVLIVLAASLIGGCSNSSEPESTGNINLSIKYSSEALPKLNSNAATGVQINKVTYILREIKFKTQNDSSDGIFKTTPLVLELNLAGDVQEIGTIVVPFGTYNRLEYDIHRAEANDTSTMSQEQKVKIRPFFEGDKYSVIIEGIVVDGSTQKNFVYQSKINVKQKIDLVAPVVVSEENNSINTTMIISSAEWFLDGTTVLDPTDPKNVTKIDNNIRESVRVFKDNNEDGVKD